MKTTRVNWAIKTALWGLLLCWGVQAQGAGGTGFGKYDCATWFTKEPAKDWLLGYLTGVNFILADAKKGFDPLSKVNSAEQIYLWVDNYCKANPLKTVHSAANELYIELKGQK